MIFEPLVTGEMVCVCEREKEKRKTKHNFGPQKDGFGLVSHKEVHLLYSSSEHGRGIKAHAHTYTVFCIFTVSRCPCVLHAACK